MSEPQPVTRPVRTGWRSRVDLRSQLLRVRESAFAVLQIVVAATAAYAFARYALGHPAPLLAGTVTISSLGLVRDARPIRVLQTVLGMLVGVLVAEVFVVLAGPGWWQLGLALGITLIIARFLSPDPSFAIMAAIQSVIVMAVPSQLPFGRLLDGIVGGVAALLATALIPRNPRREEVRDGRVLFVALQSAAAASVQALRRGDRLRAERALEKARGLSPLVDQWRQSLDSALAVARISPFLYAQRDELQRHERVRQQLDYATRNLRVVARRVVYLCDDGAARPVAADVLAEIMRAADLLGQSLDDISFQPPAREALLAVAAHLDPETILPGAAQGDLGLIAAYRPLAVDLLTATGMTPADARAALPRI